MKRIFNQGFTMSKFTFSRKELYDQVWSEPLTTVAKKYQTTDYVLRIICRKYKIPLPKSGHWMKIQFVAVGVQLR